jgi:hypothetical protein
MPNRRAFIKAGTAAAAGILATRRLELAGAAQAPAAPVVRRQVSVGGKRIRVIDLHAHSYFVPPVVDVVRGTPLPPRWPPPRNRLAPTGSAPRQARHRCAGAEHQRFSMGYWWYATDRDLAAESSDAG